MEQFIHLKVLCKIFYFFLFHICFAMLFLLTLLGILFALLYVLQLLAIYRKFTSRNVRGPCSLLPVVGALPFVIPGVRRDIVRFFRDAHAAYGANWGFFVPITWRTVFCTNRAENIRYILGEGFHKYEKGPVLKVRI